MLRHCKLIKRHWILRC